VSRLCEFHPGICLTTEEKARKTLSQIKKNLSQSTVYILTEHPHITKPTQTQTFAFYLSILRPHDVILAASGSGLLFQCHSKEKPGK